MGLEPRKSKSIGLEPFKMAISFYIHMNRVQYAIATHVCIQQGLIKSDLHLSIFTRPSQPLVMTTAFVLHPSRVEGRRARENTREK